MRVDFLLLAQRTSQGAAPVMAEKGAVSAVNKTEHKPFVRRTLKGGFETMNKNLKKVISAASALAVSATGVVAFAADYPDVPNTANYYQAVNELSALNVINGYDDGTFKPEENVTRAQIAKMVVTALGNTVANAAEAAKGRDTQFTDVPGSHWAAGYVSVATTSAAQNFINGYSDTTFGPEDNVTYAQAIKMLVASLGYSSLAERDGGWPSGYLKYGYSLGLTTGLSNIGNDQQLNRSQVAVLIDNALKCPIAVAGTNVLGQATVVIKDGTGDFDGTKDGYQNLLNYAHDSYLVYGRITGTMKTGDCDADEVTFDVEKSDNWEGYSLNAAKNDSPDAITMKKGALTDADSYLFSYAQAIIQQDSNDEYTLISLTPYGTSEKVEKSVGDFKALVGTSGERQLQIYKDANKSKYDTYKLDENVKVYVNGKEYVKGINDLFTTDFVVENNVGTFTLIDAPDQGKSSADGKYDYIMVTYYVDGVVDEIETKSDEIKVWFDTAHDNIDRGLLTIDLDDDDKEYNVYLDGKKVDYSEIKEGDVLSIAYDVDGYANSDSYDIYISRNTVEGRVTSVSNDSKKTDVEYTLDTGDVYKLAYDKVAALKSGTSYTIYLDAFGKIADHDELASSKKYAILENVYTSNGGADYYVDVITADGSKVSYQVKSDDYNTFKSILMEDPDKFNEAEKLQNRKAPENRVIEYTTNTKGELRLKDNATTAATGESFEGDYKSSNGRLGGKQLSEGYSSILDLSDYDMTASQSYSQVAISSLKSDTTYKGYAFGKSTSSTKDYQFVIITSGIGGFAVDNNWAVYVQTNSITTDNGDNDAVVAYVNGEQKTIPTDVEKFEGSSKKALSQLSTGDIFFYTTNGDGEIDKIKFVAAMPSSYRALFNDAVANEFDVIDSVVGPQFSNADEFNQADADKNELISGFIVDAGSGSVTLATKAALNGGKCGTMDAFNTLNAKSYDVASDAVVVGYDYATNKVSNRVYAGSAAIIRSASFDRDSYQNSDKNSGVVDFTAEKATVNAAANADFGNGNFAIAKVVDGDITEILVVTPDDDIKG